MTGRLVRYSLVLVLVAVGFTVLGPTQLGGPAAYVVVDGDSMEPTYADGDLIVTRRQASYEVGDVVTFVAPDTFDSGFRVIHRIVGTDAGFITRGDNRDEVDPWELTSQDIVGASKLRLPGVGTWLLRVRELPVLVGLGAAALTFTLLSRRDRRDDEDPGADDLPTTETEPGGTTSHRASTVALFGGMLALGLGAGVLVANAASFHVESRVLQSVVVWAGVPTSASDDGDPAPSVSTPEHPDRPPARPEDGEDGHVPSGDADGAEDQDEGEGEGEDRAPDAGEPGPSVDAPGTTDADPAEDAPAIDGRP